jgi:hypothetical protein
MVGVLSRDWFKEYVLMGLGFWCYWYKKKFATLKAMLKNIVEYSKARNYKTGNT